MEQDGLITRKIYPKIPKSAGGPLAVEYSLTDLGLSLKPVLLEMENWGKAYCDKLDKK